MSLRGGDEGENHMARTGRRPHRDMSEAGWVKRGDVSPTIGGEERGEEWGGGKNESGRVVGKRKSNTGKEQKGAPSPPPAAF